jgi:protein-S-isoprenylcysteine O-methyltransferase Ste14
MNPEERNKDEKRPLSIPKKMAPVVWGVIVLVIMVLLPWGIAKIGPRLGWSQMSPSWWNLAGLAAVAAGLGLYAWCLAFHYQSYRAAVRLGFTPPELVIAGPYQISRNPMYVAGLFVWLGWVVFYGSPAILVGFLLLWSAFTFRVIPYEERQLEALFGDDYLAYKRTVRRWIGRY